MQNNHCINYSDQKTILQYSEHHKLSFRGTERSAACTATSWEEETLSWWCSVSHECHRTPCCYLHLLSSTYGTGDFAEIHLNHLKLMARLQQPPSLGNMGNSQQPGKGHLNNVDFSSNKCFSFSASSSDFSKIWFQSSSNHHWQVKYQYLMLCIYR